MAQILPKAIKRIFVRTKLDLAVAWLYHISHNKLIKRCIPGPSYYKHGETRLIKRRGVSYLIAPSDLSQWSILSDCIDNHYEVAVKHMKKGKGTIIDIGANIGHFTLPIAKYIKDNNLDKKVISFEPNPNVFSLITQNIKLNPSIERIIECNPIGLGAKKAKLIMHIPTRNSGAGTLVGKYDHENHMEHSVDIQRLDDIVTEVVDFIKIDVEDYEYFVVKGAEQIIKKYKPVIYFETNTSQVNQKELFELLKSLGYALLVDKEGEWVEVNQAEIIGRPIMNVLAKCKSNEVSQNQQ